MNFLNKLKSPEILNLISNFGFLLLYFILLILCGEIIINEKQLFFSSKNASFFYCEKSKKHGFDVITTNPLSKSPQDLISNLKNYDALKLYVGKLEYIQSVSKASSALNEAKLQINQAASESEAANAYLDYEQAKETLKRAFYKYRDLCNSCTYDEAYKDFKSNFVTIKGKPQSLLNSNLEDVSVEEYCNRLNYITNRVITFVNSGIAKHCADHVHNNTLPYEGFTSKELVSYYYEIKILYDEIELLHNWLDVIPEYAEAYNKNYASK